MHDRRIAVEHAHRLDDPARKLWLPPGEVVGDLNLRAAESVADVGAGTGYFALPIAHALGSRGKVYAVDAQNEMLALLMKKARQSGIANIVPIHATAESTGLPSSSCDHYFLALVWHELDNHQRSAQEARRVLKTGGKVAILDWRPDVEPEQGPPLAHRFPPSHAMEHLRTSGFHAVRHTEIGPYSWLVQGEAQP